MVYSTSTSALEVICHTPPFRLRMEEVLLNQLASIIRRPDCHPTRKLVTSLLEDRAFLDHRIITPVHKMSALKKEAEKFGINMINVQRAHRITKEDMTLPSLTLEKTPWSGLGNSSTRTPEQAALARSLVKDTIEHYKRRENTIVAFTDGSALMNPGPCGSASVLFRDGEENAPVISKLAVSTNGSSYLAELHAISLAIRDAIPLQQFQHLLIMSDCQSALTSLSSSTTPDLHADIILEIRKASKHWKIEILLSLVCGSVDMPKFQEMNLPIHKPSLLHKVQGT